MEYIKNTTDFSINAPTVLSLGKFDGLHMGHKYLIEHLFAEKKNGLKAVVFTFNMPPRSAIEKENVPVLTTNQEKEYIFESCGIDYLVECPFTEEIRNMEAADFIGMLVERLHVKSIVVGTDFRFGHNRGGDYRLLESLAERYGYRLEVVEKMKYKGEDISSTFVRREIEKGNIELANRLLGYEFFIEERVVEGRRLGRTIDVPTINLIPPADKLLPPLGVYVAKVIVNGKEYGGIANIGKKPTVGSNNPIGIETHIFDFSGDIYGKKVRVSLLAYIRKETQFDNLHQLREQINADIAQGKAYLKEYQLHKLWH